MRFEKKLLIKTELKGKGVSDLKVGDLVDLISCPYLNTHPSAREYYAEVTAVIFESHQCVVVSYRGIDRVGYHPGTVLQAAKKPGHAQYGFEFLYLNPTVLQVGDHLLLPSGRLENVMAVAKDMGSPQITVMVNEESGQGVDGSRLKTKMLRRDRPVLTVRPPDTLYPFALPACAIDFLMASEDAAWRECGATDPENTMIASLGGYRAIMEDPEKQERCADTLAALLANRVIDVSQYLGSQGWHGHGATVCTFQVRADGGDMCVVLYEGQCAHTSQASGRAMHVIHRLSEVDENMRVLRWSTVPDILDCCAHEMSERIHAAALSLATAQRPGMSRLDPMLIEKGPTDDLAAHL